MRKIHKLREREIVKKMLEVKTERESERERMNKML
jgi:hypothetical protein